MKKSLSPLLIGGILALAAGAVAAESITFYQREGFTGRNFTADQAVSDFDRTGFNDRIQSAVVHEGRWEVCVDAHFKGDCVVLTPGNYPNLGAYAGKISSVRLAAESQAENRPNDRGRYRDSRMTRGEANATLYSRPNLSGRSYPINDMTPNLESSRFNDRASSLRVDSGYWIFCSEAEFRGDCRTFGPGEYDSLPGMNNSISSGRLISSYYPYADKPDWQRDSRRR